MDLMKKSNKGVPALHGQFGRFASKFNPQNALKTYPSGIEMG
jgi:hypothetical protein